MKKHRTKTTSPHLIKNTQNPQATHPQVLGGSETSNNSNGEALGSPVYNSPPEVRRVRCLDYSCQGRARRPRLTRHNSLIRIAFISLIRHSVVLIAVCPIQEFIGENTSEIGDDNRCQISVSMLRNETQKEGKKITNFTSTSTLVMSLQKQTSHSSL